MGNGANGIHALAKDANGIPEINTCAYGFSRTNYGANGIPVMANVCTKNIPRMGSGANGISGLTYSTNGIPGYRC